MANFYISDLHMDYTPRTLDEIIEGDARHHEENPDAL